MDYTQEEVIDALKGSYVGLKTRKRHLTDRRYYLIALLYYKFKLIEHDIFNYTALTNRSSVHHAKRLGVELYKSEDVVFIRNVKDLIEKFPYDFPDDSVKVQLKPGLRTIKFKVSPTVMEKLQRYADRKSFDSVDIGAKHIITNLLKLWEE
tara:strand:- start:428 stop:880 length:453 start_codon:yes stop_codon:yes gene_type:complete